MYLEKQDGDVLILPTDTFDMWPERGSPADGVCHDPSRERRIRGEPSIIRKQTVAVCGHDPHISTMIHHPGYGPSGTQSVAGRRGRLIAAGGKSRGAALPAAVRWLFNRYVHISFV